jgi:hypothetical protein
VHFEYPEDLRRDVLAYQQAQLPTALSSC